MTSRVFAVLVLLLFFTAPVASAQESAELPVDVAEALGRSSDEIAALEPNPSWSDLGLFSDDSLRVIEAATTDRGVITYAFGDDPNGTPVFVPPGATATGSGAMYWHVPETWVAPAEGWGSESAFAQTSGSQLQPGDVFLLLWMEMDSDYDFTSTRQINEGFPLTLPGLPVWNSTFAGDTWEGANVIPNAIYDNGVLSVDVKRYEPPQSFPIVDLPAFYYRSGNIMAMGVSADGLVALAGGATDIASDDDGQPQSLLFTGDPTDVFAHSFESALDEILYEVEWYGWSHITENGQFTPGFILYLIETYGPIEAFVALDAAEAWFSTPAPEPAEEPVEEPVDETDEAADADPPPASDAPTDEADDTDGGETSGETEEEQPTDTGGGSIPWIPIGIGFLAVGGVGAFIAMKKPTDEGDCSEEKARWDAEEAGYQEAVGAVGEAQEALADSVEERQLAGRAFTAAKAEVPPDGTDSVTDERTGETITSLDRWLRNRYADAEWNAYQRDPNPETARAYEDAMRAADTPEAREARRRDGEQAKQAADAAEAALQRAKAAEAAAEGALERRHRDVATAREMADAARTAYEECTKEKAEFDRKSAEAKRRYDEAVRRDRESRERTDGGDEPTSGPGGGTAIASPNEPTTGSACSPLGATKTDGDRFKDDVLGDAGVVTIEIARTHGTWDSTELEGDSGDPFLGPFGAGTGAGETTAVFHLPAEEAVTIDIGSLVENFRRRADWVEDSWDATTTAGVDLTVSWDYRRVEATCSGQYQCTVNGWQPSGTGTYAEGVARPLEYRRRFEIGAGDPSDDLRVSWRALREHIAARDALFNFQEQCHLR